MKPNFIYRTNYFRRPTTWIKRIFLILFVIIFALTWNVEPNSLKYYLAGFISIIILILRRDDLAVDSKYFYYYKTSILPFLTQVEKYEIKRIRSIRGRAHKSWFWALKNRPSLSGSSDSWIELTFENNESVSLKISIYKSDMDRIIRKVKTLKMRGKKLLVRRDAAQ